MARHRRHYRKHQMHMGALDVSVTSPNFLVGALVGVAAYWAWNKYKMPKTPEEAAKKMQEAAETVKDAADKTKEVADKVSDKTVQGLGYWSMKPSFGTYAPSQKYFASRYY